MSVEFSSFDFQTIYSKMPIHHLMIGTWTPPGAIFTVAFDDEKLTMAMVKRTEIPQDEPISWMTFDVSTPITGPLPDAYWESDVET